MREKVIEVIQFKPGEHPKYVKLRNKLKDLQDAVAIGSKASYNLIEIMPMQENDVVVLCNEEGRLIPLKGNRYVEGNLIAGTFYIVGSLEDEFCSLSPELKVKYFKKYYEPDDIPDEVVDDIPSAILI